MPLYEVTWSEFHTAKVAVETEEEVEAAVGNLAKNEFEITSVEEL